MKSRSFAHAPRAPESGSGQSLDRATRARMETGFGQPLPDVELHHDDSADRYARSLGAQAVTVGHTIALRRDAPGPGTFRGDALLAHELAHTLQQTGSGGPIGRASSTEEHEANLATAGVVARLEGVESPAPTVQPRAGLRLARCVGCSSCNETPQEVDVLATLGSATDGASMISAAQDLSDDQLATAESRFSSDGQRVRVIRWIRALRGRRWADLLTIHTDGNPALHGLSNAPTVVEEAIRNGGVSVTVTGEEGDREDAYGLLFDLAGGARGFELLLSLLAQSKPVVIEMTRDAEVDATTQERHPEGSESMSDHQLVRFGADGQPLAPAQQTPGPGTGSVIRLNPERIRNMTGLARDESGQLVLRELDPTVILGHELIHALHNARGENIGARPMARLAQALGRPLDQVRDPGTGLNTNAEELRTISGQTRGFQAPRRGDGQPTNVQWPLSFGLDAGITEHDLDRERGEDQLRVSHKGAQTRATGTGRVGDTPETLVDRSYRYRNASGQTAAIPAALRAHLVSWARANNAAFVLGGGTATRVYQAQLMHPSHAALYFGAIANNEAMAEAANRLELR